MENIRAPQPLTEEIVIKVAKEFFAIGRATNIRIVNRLKAIGYDVSSLEIDELKNIINDVRIGQK